MKNVIKNIVMVLGFTCSMGTLGAMEKTSEVKRIVKKKSSKSTAHNLKKSAHAGAWRTGLNAWLAKNPPIKEIEETLTKEPQFIEPAFQFFSSPENCSVEKIKFLFKNFNASISDGLVAKRVQELEAHYRNQKSSEAKMVLKSEKKQLKEGLKILSKVLDVFKKEASIRLKAHKREKLLAQAYRYFEDRDQEEVDEENMIEEELVRFEII